MITADDTRDRTPFVRPLSELRAADPAIVGSKAATLARLRDAGFPVPDGYVVGSVSVSDLRLPSLQDAISAGLQGLGGGPVAVRSSAAAEDLVGASYAGQYESVLGVEGVGDVLDAIERVLRSAESARVVRYREHAGAVPGASAVAVLVQRMVAPDAAGVAFTADPVTGQRERVVISAVRGLGDRLVSGEAQPDEWVVDRDSAERRRSVDDAIDAAVASRVAELARRIDAHEGGPQDVEWATVGPTLFVLQARPMTALPVAVSWESPLPGGWARDFRLGEWLGDPVTPLFESWLLTRLENQLHRNYAQMLGVALPEPAHVIVNGWYFYGVNFVPTRPLAMVAMIVRHLLPRLILRPRRTAMAFPPLANVGIGLAEREWRTHERPRYRRLVADAAGEVQSATPLRLASMIDDLADAAGDYFTALTKVAGYASKAQLPLARFYARHLEPRIGGSHLDLLIGLGEKPPAAVSHAVRTLDWWEPTLGESAPRPDTERTRSLHAGARNRRLDAEVRTRAALETDRRLLRRFERLLGEAQRFALVREDLVAELTLPWPVLRRAVARLGATLTQQGVLERPDQVWFVTHDEISAALRGSSEPIAPSANARSHVWQDQRRVVPPLRLGSFPPMMQRMLDAAERVVRGPATRRPDDIVGVPASPGRASGPARIVRSTSDFERVMRGDVLVASMTAPAWTPLFDRLAAVVTDTGSVAAHASIVAREYGLPAVVGTADATVRLRDGDLVEVDGSAGVVRRLSPDGTDDMAASARGR